MIEVRNLVKQFGSITAVADISFTVERGEVLGFLGPNGAGKSTTMKIVTCFIPPTSGTVIVGGKDILSDSVAVREQIGYLPESAPSYGEMTVQEFLGFIAEVRGFQGAERERRVDAVSDLTSLAGVRDQIIETLSKGYRQRVCFAQALLHDPPVLILDEPTDGLDPNQKHQMREVIRRMGATKTIILSTHILEEMEAVCTRAIIIAEGRIVADGTPDQLAAMSALHNAVVIRTGPDTPESLLKTLRAVPGVAEVQTVAEPGGRGLRYVVLPSGKQVILPEVTRMLDKKHIPFDEVYAERGRMDEVFRALTLGTAEPGAAVPGTGPAPGAPGAADKGARP
jgi:ABC-2 type transport system ATP-binding protein